MITYLLLLITTLARAESVTEKSARSAWYLKLALQPTTSSVIISNVFSPSLTRIVTSRWAFKVSVFLKVSKIIPIPVNFSCDPWSSPGL